MVIPSEDRIHCRGCNATVSFVKYYFLNKRDLADAGIFTRMIDVDVSEDARNRKVIGQNTLAHVRCSGCATEQAPAGQDGGANEQNADQDGDANEQIPMEQDLGANEQNADQDEDANEQVPIEQDLGANEQNAEQDEDANEQELMDRLLMITMEVKMNGIMIKMEALLSKNADQDVGVNEWDDDQNGDANE
ncbi:hypothetical protein BC332_17142 [Capsicum chinense]|nr:hypothetical protein BC332_17142 [Capsicum chinense]